MEQVILVNDKDEVIGAAEKIRAHRENLCHRAFSVFIFREINKQRELLLQKRQHTKYHCGGLWTNTCCGHPRPGEDIVQAARRRLREELNLDMALREKGVFHYVAACGTDLVENEIDHVLIGDYNDELIKPNLKEIAEIKWLPIDCVQRDLLTHPNQYTPWFLQALSQIED